MLHDMYSIACYCAALRVARCRMLYACCTACMLRAVRRMLRSRQVHRDDLPLQRRSCQVTPCYVCAHGMRVCTHADWVSRRRHVRAAGCSLPRFLTLCAACHVVWCVPRVAGTSWMRTGNGRYRCARRRSFTLATDPPNARARTHARTHSRTHARLPEVPPPPLPLPSAVLAVLHHAGAPGRSCASRASRGASVSRCALHDARCPLLMPRCRPCATPPSRIFRRKSIN